MVQMEETIAMLVLQQLVLEVPFVVNMEHVQVIIVIALTLVKVVLALVIVIVRISVVLLSQVI
jgi:hypothetical protein